VQKDQSVYSARLKRKETQQTSVRQVTCTWICAPYERMSV